MLTKYRFKKIDKLPPREGRRGKGVRLPFSCAFCTERFRTAQQRTQHAKDCKETKKNG